MRERSLKRRTAFILAVLLTFMNCFSSFASETTEDKNNTEIEENITIDEGNDGNNTLNDEEGEHLGKVHRVSDDLINEDITDESLEINKGLSVDDNTDVSISDNDNIKIEVDEEAEESESDNNAGETESDTLIKSSLVTSRILRLGSSGVQRLGANASGDIDENYKQRILAGEWQTLRGVKWQLSGNILTISENTDPLIDESDRGRMSDLSWSPTKGSTSEYLYFADRITKVEFVGSIKRIGAYAFAGCSRLSTFTIPKYVEEIGFGAFVNCTELSSIGLNQENDHFISGTGADGDGILYQKNTISRNGVNEFDGTLSLLFCPVNKNEKVNIRENTTKILNYAFYGCSGIGSELEIPETVKSIGFGSFWGCSNLPTVKIGKRKPGLSPDYTGNSLERIEDTAFQRCVKLSAVYIPDTVSFVGSNSFEEDTNLRYIIFYATDSSTSATTLDNRYGACGLSAIITALNTTHATEKKIQSVMALYNQCVVFFNKTRSTVDQMLHAATVAYGHNLDKSQLPTPEYNSNFRFDGWWTGSDGEGRRHEGKPGESIEGDTTLYAKWVELIYIEFNLNGGVISNSPEDITDNFTVSADKGVYFDKWPAVDPTINGVKGTFIGWFDDISNKTFIRGSTSTVNTYYASQPMSFSNTDNKKIFIKSRTLTAVYLPFVTINFYSPSLNDAISSCTLPVGSKLNKGEIDSIQNDYRLAQYENDATYEFRGWFTKGGTQLNVYNDLSEESLTEYYATYDRYATFKYYNIDNQGNYNTPSVTERKKVPSTYSVKASPNLNGYQFQGWYEFPNGQGVKYNGTLQINDRKTEYNMYAYWLPIYKVTTDDQKTRIGADKDTTQTYDIVSGASIYSYGRIPKDTINDGKDWAFAGWFTEKEGKGVQVDRSYAISRNMTVYADWSEGLRVAYYVDSAGAEYDSYIAQYDTSLVVPDLPSQEWADHNGYMGYDCVGWFTKDGERATPNMKVTKNNLEFFGKWEDNPDRENEPHYVVSFNSMGGPDVPSQRVAENTLLSIPEVGTWTDHKFIGWYKDKEFKEEWNFFEDKVTEDGWLYAKWIEWTEEDEDNAHGIYWVRMLRGGKAPLTEYFRESGLQFSYDKSVVKLLQKGRTVKGKRVGETLITATKGDGSEYPVKVRAFVFKQELQDMYAFNTSTTLNAPDFLTVSGFLPDRWESTKTSVASVDPKTGLITVRGRGRTKIKAYYENKPVTATLYCEVPKFAKKFYRFKTGQSKKIKIKKVKKSDIVSWNIVSVSGDNSGGKSGGISGNGTGFAEVDNNGVVTAVSAGEVTLQATVYGQTITTKLHIEPPTLKTKQIQINVNKVKRLKLSRTKLKYVEWKSSNDSVAYVDPTSGKVYALKPGRVTLRTTAGGVTNTCNVIIEDPQAASASTLSKTANSTLKK